MKFFLRRSAPLMKKLPILIFLCSLISVMTAPISPSYAQEVPEENTNKTETENTSDLLTIPTDQVLRIYMAKNKAYNARMHEILKENVRTISHSCRKISHVSRNDPVIYTENLTFPKKRLKTDIPGHPTFGQWKDGYTVHACDRDYIFNFIASALQHSAPYILPLVNGTSRIDPIYQQEAEYKIYNKIDNINPSLCQNGGLKMVYDTQFVGYIQPDKTIGPENKNLGWFENWTVWQCQELKNARVAVVQKANQVFNILVRYENK